MIHIYTKPHLIAFLTSLLISLAILIVTGDVAEASKKHGW